MIKQNPPVKNKSPVCYIFLFTIPGDIYEDDKGVTNKKKIGPSMEIINETGGSSRVILQNGTLLRFFNDWRF